MPLTDSDIQNSVKHESIMRLCARISAFLLALASALYFLTAMRFSAHNPLWMDEVLAVWTARLNSIGGIWSALSHGAEFAPPMYHILLMTVMRFGGTGNLALRMPSLLAVFVAACAAFVLLRRRFSLPIAGFGMTLVLMSALYDFAVQARPYAIVAACFAVALVLWDAPSGQNPSGWKCALLFLVLLLAVSLHFYAVLIVAELGLLELLWFALHRRIRFQVWAAIIGGGLSVLVWAPLAMHISKYNSGDVRAPQFYGKPSAKRFLAAYSDLMLDKSDLLLLLVFVSLAAVCLAIFFYFPQVRSFASWPEPKRNLGDLDLIVLSSVALPFTTFCFALLVTKNFNLRYAVASVVGFALLFGRLLAYLKGATIVSTVLLFFSCIVLAGRASISTGTERADINPLLHRATKPLPIVIAGGLDFIEFEEAADPALKSRLVFVTMPPGAVSPDPTNENQVKRWGTIRSDLNIVNSQAFFNAHPQFYIVNTATTTDVLTPWLMQRGDLEHVVATNGNNWLFEATAPKLAANN